MNTLLHHPITGPELVHESARGKPIAPGGNNRGEISRRVAVALGINPEGVSIEDSLVSPAGWIMRCTGTANHTRFWAKVYLVDPYPITPRFAVPGEELSGHTEVCRPVQEQIATEWKRVQQMRALVGGRNSPAPLGYSLKERILILEEVRGSRADDLARWAWPGTGRLRSVEQALFHAGAWLRNLHQVSCRGHDSVIPIEILRQAHRLAAQRPAESLSDKRLALKPLEAACRQIGPRTPVRVPVAMNHGDFSLPNLLWEARSEHLWVLDYELSSYGSVLHDLGMMVFDLRRRLLHPLTPPRAVCRLEASFWAGYGRVEANIRLLASAAATHRLLYHSIPKIATLGARRGRLGGMKALAYKHVFQRVMIARVLQEG